MEKSFFFIGMVNDNKYDNNKNTLLLLNNFSLHVSYPKDNPDWLVFCVW